MKRVAVFCGSTIGARSVYATETHRLGEGLVRRGLGLVYGGGHVGLMGVLADAVVKAGGSVIGVIPAMLVEKELAFDGGIDLRIVTTMHERKALMAELADGFIALPGGFGTLEEFSEMVTWAQLGLHQKPCALLNCEGFFDPFLAFLDCQVAQGFVAPHTRALVRVAHDPESLLDDFVAALTPGVSSNTV
ncbi:MAG: TIGR00730 family Rossman fold protein [Nitrospirae bacterium]|nr:MAG: TIGR00730 family Rossman fold protein [Nitrospirota bacterium]